MKTTLITSILLATVCAFASITEVAAADGDVLCGFRCKNNKKQSCVKPRLSKNEVWSNMGSQCPNETKCTEQGRNNTPKCILQAAAGCQKNKIWCRNNALYNCVQNGAVTEARMIVNCPGDTTCNANKRDCVK